MAVVALVGAVRAVPAATPARRLERVAVAPGIEGTVVRLELSRPTTARLAVVRGSDGGLRRIHVDLPAGTTSGPRGTLADASEPPVLRVRVARTDGDRVRVVIDVDAARDYRIEPDTEPGTIVISVLGDREAPAAPAAERAAPPAAPAPAPPRAAVRTRRRPKVVLDPGHGGDDPGAEGYVVEKEVTLDVARRLARLLRERLGAEVVLTRKSDATLALKERTARANAEDADLFVSIHANANPTGGLRGVETYYLDNSTDRATLRLAGMENGLDLLGPKSEEASLRYILSDLVQVGKLDQSARLARSIQRGLVGTLRRRYDGVVDLGVKRGPFYVLVGAYMPCVLVETAFVTHPVEGRRVARGAYRQEVAQGLYDGIARYLRDGAQRRTL